MKFRKRPIVVEAIKWTGQNVKEVANFANLSLVASDRPIFLHTLEGIHKTDVGDWIIKGIQGEFYPIKNDIFLETYEKVED